MKGLPDDRCQCPHWGYVVPGTELVTFSPAEELRKTEAVMMKNMQEMQAG